jgi:hypothetical protein
VAICRDRGFFIASSQARLPETIRLLRTEDRQLIFIEKTCRIIYECTGLIPDHISNGLIHTGLL